jgi:hypothetical protein
MADPGEAMDLLAGRVRVAPVTRTLIEPVSPDADAGCSDFTWMSLRTGHRGR